MLAYFLYLLIELTVRINGYGGTNTRRRIPLEKQEPTVVHQKPGPLQTIFELHPDEVTNRNEIYRFFINIYNYPSRHKHSYVYINVV
jgi:hypothetical protein